jgi:hypothetical protein
MNFSTHTGLRRRIVASDLLGKGGSDFYGAVYQTTHSVVAMHCLLEKTLFISEKVWRKVEAQLYIMASYGV